MAVEVSGITVDLPGALLKMAALLLVRAFGWQYSSPTGIDQGGLFIDWTGLIAGKPRAHRFCGVHKICVRSKPCRSVACPR
ncbi:hypothetical protein C1X33_12910 [Pseudomonas sp. GW460-E13]|nr:hypothetical protein C1X31_06005 [Pseudomonas sp. GW456-11-11-14-LB2]PMW96970.1 hypothetical protein C1X33_12910 [Pseudomonas sp. GW460-E13]PMY33127.1 hypothetical protein C1X37_13600 [Pseudomonas sp. FW305-3-2-15-A-R2A1]PNA46059.1 hypothetical protein C1X44_32835 [Pseudomonas sp. MPR-AND1A]